MIRSTIAGIVVFSALFAGCASSRNGPPPTLKAPEGPHTLKKLSVEERHDLLLRAQVWQAINTSSLDLAKGPALPSDMRIGAQTNCAFSFPDKPLTGNTPKFLCELKKGDVVKVKYDAKNGEVYAEVAGTRLLWALGFKSDAMIPSLVVCTGCPLNAFAVSSDEWDKGVPASDAPMRTYDPAVIERPFVGKSIEVPGFEGWAWPELEQVSPASGGAPREQIDALKLLAVFIQHSDSKAEQQDIVCTETGRIDGSGNETCHTPWLVIKDLGATFGKATRLNSSKMTLADWDSMPIWRDPAQCIGDLPRSLTGSLDNPHISEAGRAFLSKRLAMLSDKQLRDLFTVSNVESRGEMITDKDGTKRKATVADWVGVFKRKRSEIAAARCPA